MNLKAFMKEDLKDRGTMEFPGIERFTDEKGKPIPFIIKRLSRKEIKEIRELYETKQVFRDKNNGNRPIISGNGQVAIMRDYDSDSAGRHIMVEAFVQPKLDAPELMEYYGVLDRLDMPSILFPNKDEMEYADQCLMIACGLKSEKNEKEVIDDVKN
nr:MAG TPA: tail assembly chaperone protein [Caudoviricetes sp.]